jgi:hypothetical protein
MVARAAPASAGWGFWNYETRPPPENGQVLNILGVRRGR